MFLKGGWFNISTGEYGAGIGSADASGEGGLSVVETISISAGSFHVIGGANAAGIGSGRSAASALSVVRKLVIGGGNLIVTGSVALGSLEPLSNEISFTGNSAGVSLTCDSVSVTACMCGSAIRFGALPVRIRTSTAIAFESSSTALASGHDILVEYGVPSVSHGIVNGGFLHFGTVRPGWMGPTVIQVVTGDVSESVVVREVEYDSASIVGLMFSLAAPGNYSMLKLGHLLCASNLSVFEIQSSEEFYDDLTLCINPTATFNCTLPLTNSDESAAIRDSKRFGDSREFGQSKMQGWGRATEVFTFPANVYRIRRKVRSMYLFTALVVQEWGNGAIPGF
jgi:hypothetical protein